MSPEENKAIVRRFYDEVLNGRNMRLLPELWHESAVNYFAGFPEPLRGLHALEGFAGQIFGAFPDLYITIEDLLAEGDRVVNRWTGRGTHRGDFMGVPPTGKPVTITSIDIYRLEAGKIAEEWASADLLGILRQIGATPGSES